MRKVAVSATRLPGEWVQQILPGFEELVAKGDRVVISDRSIRVYKSRPRLYNQDRAGKGEGQPS